MGVKLPQRVPVTQLESTPKAAMEDEQVAVVCGPSSDGGEMRELLISELEIISPQLTPLDTRYSSSDIVVLIDDDPRHLSSNPPTHQGK